MDSWFEKGVNRRDFLKIASAAVAALGLSKSLTGRLAQAMEAAASGKPPVIWLQGQNCTGCSVSFLNSAEPEAGRIVLDILSVRYHPTISAAAGELAIKSLLQNAEDLKDKFYLLIEGPIPVAEEGRFCSVGEVQGKDWTMMEMSKHLLERCAAVISVGNCASYGGIPAANKEVTGSTPVKEFMEKNGIKKPLISIGGCPINPRWLVGAVVAVLTGTIDLAKDLDQYNRPKMFFGSTIHDNCPRRAAFEAGKFVEDYNDTAANEMQYCLLKKGCKGPVTYADCPIGRWNNNENWCIGAGAPCHGCAEPAFYAGLSPLYEKLPGVSVPYGIGLGKKGWQTSADTIGKGLAAAAGVGVAAHFLVKGRKMVAQPVEGAPRKEGEE